MALVRTTLTGAVGVDDTTIVVASATSIVAGRLFLIDQEMMQAVQSYVSGTTVGVLRARNGSTNTAHVVTAGVVHGDAADFDNPAAQAAVTFPIGARGRVMTSITADNSTVVHAPAGADHTVILNGTAVINLTVPIPTVDMDGCELNIVANGTAAHIVTFTGGVGGEGASYDVITFNSGGPVAMKFVAANAVWLWYCQPAGTGTVTNLVAGIA